MSSYQYRCTEQQLEAHLKRVDEAGDVVEHVIFKGGRDYVLICRKAPEPIAVRIVSPDAEEFARIIAKAVRAGSELGRRLGR